MLTPARTMMRVKRVEERRREKWREKKRDVHGVVVCAWFYCRLHPITSGVIRLFGQLHTCLSFFFFLTACFAHTWWGAGKRDASLVGWGLEIWSFFLGAEWWLLIRVTSFTTWERRVRGRGIWLWFIASCEGVRGSHAVLLNSKKSKHALQKKKKKKKKFCLLNFNDINLSGVTLCLKVRKLHTLHIEFKLRYFLDIPKYPKFSDLTHTYYLQCFNLTPKQIVQ